MGDSLGDDFINRICLGHVCDSKGIIFYFFLNFVSAWNDVFFMNMNMKVVYYFIVYAELRYVNAKLLPYEKRLYSAAP